MGSNSWLRSAAVLALAAAAVGSAVVGAGDRERASAPLSAVPAQEITVFPGHPRLIVGGYRGVPVDAVRAACSNPEMRGECAQISSGILSDAMLYLLNGDTAAANRVKSLLLTGASCGDGYEHSSAGGTALAYDWIAETVVNAAEKQRIEASLALCGARIAEGLRDPSSAHLWHGFTSQAASLALIALAVDDPPERPQLLADARELFRGRALEAYALVGGAWPEGYNYERSHFFSADPPDQYVMDALRAWDSAVQRDHPRHESLFDTIRDEEGDWLLGLGLHVLYGSIDPYGADGKRTLLRGGDMPTGQAYPNKQYRPFTDAIARLTSSGELRWWGQSLEDDWSFVGGNGTYHPIHRYALPLDLPLDVPARPPADLPLARIWSRDELGYIIARDSWTAPGTLIGYRAGKWFTGHQHMDQGHIDIWRNGPLALDAGVYADWGSRHRELYYMRTVAHNTLLIHRAGETFDQHPSPPLKVNDDGQRVLTYRGCPQCMQSVEEWRTNVNAGLHFEAGTIDAFRAEDAFMAVASDLTSAYNSTRYASPGNVAKVESVQRDLLYLRPRVLLVADRTVVTEGTDPPRFVLHFPTRPSEPLGDLVAGTADNGILTSAAQRFVMDNGTGGRLVGRTLAPEAITMTLLGGPNYRYWADGANQLDGSRPHEGAPAEPGAWRVEVQPAANPGRATLLLHALTITDEGADEAVVAALPASGEPAAAAPLVYAVGETAATIAVLSSAVPRAALLEVSFAAPGPARLVAMNLEVGAEYRMAVGDPTVAVARGIADEGAWEGEVPGAGAVLLARCPAPPRASWEALCADPTPTPTATPRPSATPDRSAGRAYVPDAQHP